MKKNFSVIELIAVVCVVLILSGLGYCVYQIETLKIKAEFVREVQDWKQWRNNVTTLINSNLKEGNLKPPVVTPQPKPKVPGP